MAGEIQNSDDRFRVRQSPTQQPEYNSANNITRFYLCGCLLLTLTSLPVALDNGAGIGGLVASMLLIGAGVGAVKATFFPLVGMEVNF